MLNKDYANIHKVSPVSTGRLPCPLVPFQLQSQVREHIAFSYACTLMEYVVDLQQFMVRCG